MTNILVESSGFIMIALFFSLIAGGSLIDFLKGGVENREERISRLAQLLSRSRLTFAVCSVVFFIFVLVAAMVANEYVALCAGYFFATAIVALLVDLWLHIHSHAEENELD